MPAAAAMQSLAWSDLSSAYAAGSLTPTALIQQLYPELAETNAIFIHLVSLEDLLARCNELEAQPAPGRGKLWGVPFAVKDNVDVAGIPTTAACQAFKYVPEKSSPAVDQLLAAGGLKRYILVIPSSCRHVWDLGSREASERLASLQRSFSTSVRMCQRTHASTSDCSD